MHNLARQLVAVSCVFATGFVAGTTPKLFSSDAEAASFEASETSESKPATPLAVADELCSAPSNGVVAISKEACRVPGGAPFSPEPIDEMDYEPAWMTGMRKLDFPFRGYPRIERYVQYWTGSQEGRRIFRTWLKRSGKYRGEVDKALASRKLPLDLAALVFVESGFSPTAKSKAGAVGLWQLMPKTAKEYGLLIDRDYDERRSVSKSSEAAVDHLSSLYGKLGSWELVLAAYDMGARALYKKMQNLEAVDFWALTDVDGALPKETAKYVPQIIAFALVLKNLDHFGYDTIKLDQPTATSDLDVPAGVPLSLVAQAANTSLARIRELNPEFLKDYVPDEATVVHVPANGLARARIVLPHLLFDGDSGYDSERTAPETDYGWGQGGAGTPRASGGTAPRSGKDGKGAGKTKRAGASKDGSETEKGNPYGSGD